MQIDPNKGISHRTSSTSIGLYLVSLLVAEKLRLLPAAEAAGASVKRFPRWKRCPNGKATCTASMIPGRWNPCRPVWFLQRTAGFWPSA